MGKEKGKEKDKDKKDKKKEKVKDKRSEKKKAKKKVDKSKQKERTLSKLQSPDLQKRIIEASSKSVPAASSAASSSSNSNNAGVDPAFSKAGQIEGLQILRIEKFQVKDWPKNFYGQFYSGDSYIVLFTQKRGGSTSYDIHFWLGNSTSQDEAGTAAYKTVELDTLLGGSPVQHREVQGGESEKFCSYFKGAIRIMEGGVETGFNIVTPTQYRPRLLHIHGNVKKMTVNEVELSGDSLATGDVFVLDNGLEVFQWNGAKADPTEKMHATKLLAELHSERNGKVAKPIIMDEGSEEAKFWQILGGKTEISKHVHQQHGPKRDKSLHKLSDASGKMTFSEVGRGKISKSALKSEDVFILDDGVQVFSWVGSKSSPNEKKKRSDLR
jgi:gelsolin